MSFTDVNPKIEYIDGVYTYKNKKLQSESVKRIENLKIPKVYKTIWLSNDVSSDIQAIALDSKGKKQYYYSPSWIDKRSCEKFKRMYAFLGYLPLLHEHIARDIKDPWYSKKRVIAFMIMIVEQTSIRIGNKKYSDKNDSFGLTTLKKEHVVLKGSNVYLSFQGKHQVPQKLFIKNVKIANFLRKMCELPGEWIMKYKGSDGNF
jgi:DNA topoisomerase I